MNGEPGACKQTVKRVLLTWGLLLACSAGSSTAPSPAGSGVAVTTSAPAEPRIVAPTPTEVEPEPAAPAPARPEDLDALAEALRALEPDPAPAHTTNDTHYLVSNERRHDLFRPELDDLGGVMLGVGSDQSYVMAPWSKTELLVIVDFDDKVVDLHAIHGALMQAAPTVEELRRLWSEDGAEDARAAIGAAFESSERRRALLALYEDSRETVAKRLLDLTRRYEELGIHSYLDTPEQYRFLVDLHARGHVVALRGDFTVDGVLRRVAQVLAEHERTVKVLYLSNIEQYFTYRKPFKANMAALPFDDDTMVLRTLPGRPAGFNYIVQRGDDFRAWLDTPKVYSVYRIRGFVKGEPLEANKRFVVGPPPAALAGE